MAIYEDNARALNDQAPIIVTYPTNHQPKRYVMCDDSVKYQDFNKPPLLATEIVEQCLALIHAMLNIENQGVRESLIYVLQDRLLLLESKLV